MAKIILDVELQSVAAEKSAKALKIDIDRIAKSLNSIDVNKDVTAQLNALAKSLNAVTRNVKAQNQAEERSAIAKAKLAKAQADQQAAVERSKKAHADYAASLARERKAEEQLEMAITKRKNAENGKTSNLSEDKEILQLEKLQQGYSNLIGTISKLSESYPTGVFDNLSAEAEKGFNSLLNLEFGTKEYDTQVQVLAEHLTRLSTELATLKQQYAGQAEAMAAFRTAEAQVTNLSKSFYNLLGSVKNVKKQYPEGTFNQLEADINQYITSIKTLDTTDTHYITTVETLSTALKNLQIEFARLKAETDKNTGSVIQHNESLLNMLPKILKWQVAMTLVMKPIQLSREALQSLNETLVETEDKVIALQRVLNTTASNTEMANSLYDIAINYGQSFEDVSQIAENFAKAGYDWNETISATKSGVLALSVAELDASEASEGMIAIMKQFKLEATDLGTVIDMLNNVADHYAVTSEGLFQALQRTGSAAAVAKLSLQETIGIITAMSEATGRAGSNIGTATQSLIQYTQKAKSLDAFAGLSEDTAKVVDDYRHGLVNILDVWESVAKVVGDADTEQQNILNNLEGMDELNEEIKNALGEDFAIMNDALGTAGVYRKNYFSALLGNIATVRKAEETANNSRNYSLQEQERYMATYTAQVTALKSQWEQLANSAQGFLSIKKGLVGFGSVLLTIIKYTGGLRTQLLLLSTIVTFLFGDKILSGITTIILKLKTLISQIVATTTIAGSIIPILLAIATVLSSVGGALQAIAEAQKESRQQAIANWKADKDNAKELLNLSKQYKTLTTDSDDYYDVENKIVNLLGDKASVLDNLTQGTDEYKKKVQELTNAQLEQYKAEQRAAKSAAEKEIKDALSGDITAGTEYLKGKDGYVKGYENLTEAVNDEYDKHGASRKFKMLSFTLEKFKPYIDDYIAASQELDEIEKVESDTKSKNTDSTNENTKAKQDNVDTTKELADRTDEYVKSLKTLSSVFNEFSEDGKISYDTIADIQEQFADVSGIDEYISKLLDTNLTAEELQNVLGELAEKQIEQKMTTGELANADERLIAKMLEENGVANASAVAHDMVRNAKTKLAIQTAITEGEIKDYIKNLKAEAEQCGLTKNELKALVAEMITASNSTLNFGQQIAALQQLGFAADVTKAKIAGVNAYSTQTHSSRNPKASFDNMVTETKNGNTYLVYYYNGKVVKRELISSAPTTPPNFTYTGSGSGGGGGGGGGDKAKTYDVTEAIINRINLLHEQQKAEIETAEDNAKRAEDERDYAKAIELTNGLLALRKTRLSALQTANAQLGTEAATIRSIYGYDEASWFDSEGNATEAYYNLLNSVSKTEQETIEKVFGQLEKYKKAYAENKKEIDSINKDIYNDEKDIRELVLKDYEYQISTLSENLTLLENQNAPIQERIGKMKQIQSLLHDEAEYLRSIEATQEEIDEISNEWWNTNKNILDTYEDILNAQRDYELDLLDKQITAIESIKDARNEELSIEEKKLAVMEAEKALQDSMKERKVRVYNEKTDTWEYQTNPKTIQDAQKNLDSAKNSYADALADKEINDLKKQRDTLEKMWDNIVKGKGKKSDVLGIMKRNSEDWYGAGTAESRMFENTNYALGSLMGLTNNNGMWYNSDGSAAYSNSVLDNLAEMMKPVGSKQTVSEFFKKLGIMTGSSVQYENGKNALVTNYGSVTNSNNTNSNNVYTINGVPITQEQADEYTITELLDAMALVGND